MSEQHRKKATDDNDGLGARIAQWAAIGLIAFIGFLFAWNYLKTFL